MFALVYGLDLFLRCLALPRKIIRWSLTTLHEKLIKIGAKGRSEHTRHVVFLMAEAAILGKIDRSRVRPGAEYSKDCAEKHARHADRRKRDTLLRQKGADFR